MEVGIITKAQANMLDENFRRDNVLSREEVISLLAVAPAI